MDKTNIEDEVVEIYTKISDLYSEINETREYFLLKRNHFDLDHFSRELYIVLKELIMFFEVDYNDKLKKMHRIYLETIKPTFNDELMNFEVSNNHGSIVGDYNDEAFKFLEESIKLIEELSVDVITVFDNEEEYKFSIKDPIFIDDLMKEMKVVIRNNQTNEQRYNELSRNFSEIKSALDNLSKELTIREIVENKKIISENLTKFIPLLDKLMSIKRITSSSKRIKMLESKIDLD